MKTTHLTIGLGARQNAGTHPLNPLSLVETETFIRHLGGRRCQQIPVVLKLGNISNAIPIVEARGVSRAHPSMFSHPARISLVTSLLQLACPKNEEPVPATLLLVGIAGNRDADVDQGLDWEVCGVGGPPACFPPVLGSPSPGFRLPCQLHLRPERRRLVRCQRRASHKSHAWQLRRTQDTHQSAWSTGSCYRCSFRLLEAPSSIIQRLAPNTRQRSKPNNVSVGPVASF